MSFEDTFDQRAVTNNIDAPAILAESLNHMANRATQRDKPDGERSMAATVASFNAMYNTSITEEQGWMFMVFLKISRASAGEFVVDDFEDGAAYFALAGECAANNAAVKPEDGWRGESNESTTKHEIIQHDPSGPNSRPRTQTANS